jgi:hypothetical protein
MTLQDAVMDYIETQDHVSFAELANRFPQFKGGELAACVPDYPTIVYWCNMQQEAADAIRNLFESKKIYFKQTTFLVYAIDGTRLNLPIAKSKRKYKNDHWLPVVIMKGKRTKEEKK